MNEYELLIETINPCGDDTQPKKKGFFEKLKEDME